MPFQITPYPRENKTDITSHQIISKRYYFMHKPQYTAKSLYRGKLLTLNILIIKGEG